MDMTDEAGSMKLDLDSWRSACLLCFFEFHEKPSRKAWSRIGALIRQAYQYGLHQLDNPMYCPLIRSGRADSGDIEAWRYVWWCVYCLDSYSNVTAATPFLVEINSIGTALIVPPVEVLLARGGEWPNLIFLPPEPDMLWKTTKDIMDAGGDTYFNIYIITTTILREASLLHRLRTQNPAFTECFQRRLSAVSDHIASLRLALPAYYLNPARNVLADESIHAHASRLTCICHLQMAQIFSLLPPHMQLSEPAFRQTWQQVLESCEAVVSVIRAWNGSYSSCIEPAICFIVHGVLLLFHLHYQSSPESDAELRRRLQIQTNVLLLFLEQFGTLWSLPKFLLGKSKMFMMLISSKVLITSAASFKKFTQVYPQPLESKESRVAEHFINHLYSRLQPPWRSDSVSSSSGSDHPLVDQMFPPNDFQFSDPNAVFQQWDAGVFDSIDFSGIEGIESLG